MNLPDCLFFYSRVTIVAGTNCKYFYLWENLGKAWLSMRHTSFFCHWLMDIWRWNMRWLPSVLGICGGSSTEAPNPDRCLDPLLRIGCACRGKRRQSESCFISFLSGLFAFLKGMFAVPTCRRCLVLPLSCECVWIQRLVLLLYWQIQVFSSMCPALQGGSLRL